LHYPPKAEGSPERIEVNEPGGRVSGLGGMRSDHSGNAVGRAKRCPPFFSFARRCVHRFRKAIVSRKAIRRNARNTK
jgi:hypothetical protein